MRSRLSVAVALVGAFAALAPARAQCPQWTGGFEVPGLDGQARAFATFDDGSGPALYVAGDFDRAAGVAANSIARWDGATWTNVGAGLAFSSTDLGIHALAVFDDGSGRKLYAAGEMTSPAEGLVRWDGASWTSVGGSLDYTLGGRARGYALAVHDDGSGPALFVAGYFNRAGGVVARSIAKWNGAAWSALAPGMNSTTSSDVGHCYALESFDDGSGMALFAGGRFLVSGVAGARSVAKWNGSSWSAVGVDPFPSPPTTITAFASYDDGSGSALYVGGSFVSVDGVATNGGLARWNGSTWSGVGSGLLRDGAPAFADALDVVDLGQGPALYVGGRFDHAGGTPAYSVARWTGAWSALGPGLASGGTCATPNAFTAIDDGEGLELLVGGIFDATVDRAIYHLALWDEVAWTPFTEGEGTLGYVAALLSTDSGPDGAALYAGGSFPSIGSSVSVGVARWDGTHWNELEFGTVGAVEALALHDDGSGAALYAGGTFTAVASGPANGVAKWNGATWSALGNGVDGGVHALASFAGELYAGGKFDHADGAVAPNIARWNGASWSDVGGGTSASGADSVDALCVFDDGSGAALYVGGDFSHAGGVVGTTNIARWNGTSWSPVGVSGASARVRALLVHDDGTGPELYAAGDFVAIGGVAANRIARWNGASWSPLGTGSSGRVYALTSFAVEPGAPAELFAAGELSSYGGLPTNRIARWDGSAWQSLGSVNDLVFALASHDDPTTPWRELFAGGFFSLAGDESSQRVARWTNPCACQATAYCTAGTTSNGCVPSISGIGTPSASSTSGFTIRIDGVEGQKQGHIFYGVNGALANPWSPLSSSYLCVKAPTQRTPTQNTLGSSGACDGAMQIDWLDYVATHPGALGAPFSAGTQVWAQLYFRDPPAPKTTNLSDGLTFVVCP